MELEPGSKVTHLPPPLLQVLNRLCPNCSWLHNDTVLHLLSEHCVSLNSQNRGQQCEQSPAGGRSNWGEDSTFRLHTNSIKNLFANTGLYTHEHYTCCPTTEGFVASSSCSALSWHTHPSLFLQVSKLQFQKSSYLREHSQVLSSVSGHTK